MSDISNHRMMITEKFADEILDVINHYDDFTTSDLQGVVSAIVMKIYAEGRKEGLR